MTNRLAYGLLGTLSLFLFACSSGDAEANKPIEEQCDDWKSSYCEKYDECGSSSDCAEFVKNLTCSTSAGVSDCVNELSRSTCDTLPTGCDPEDVADTDLSGEKCLAFHGAFCDWSESCGNDRSTCEAEVSGTIDCSRAISYADSYGKCLDDLSTHPCDATSLPPTCVGVIKTY